MKECPIGTGDRRYTECKKYGQRTSKTLFPAAVPSHASNQCLLYCRESSQTPYDTNSFVPAGTSCSYEDPHLFCIHRECKRVGCDHRIGSVKSYNNCGICGGSESDCDYERLAKKKVARFRNKMLKVHRIPVGAYDVTIEMVKPSPQQLCLKNRKTKVQVISRRVPSSPYEVVDAGANWQLINLPISNSDSRSGLRQQKIYAKGPTANEYDILLYVNKANIPSEMQIQYYKQKSSGPTIIHQPTPVSTTYYWKPFQFGKCSAECGVGTQKRKVSCCKRPKRRRGSRGRRSKCIRVPISKCPANRKPSNTQECRSECPAHWDTEIWSACSHTCKPKHASSITAVRTRRVTCIDDKKRIVQVQLCEQTAEKPVDTESCPNIPDCPNQWQLGPWSQCQCTNRATCSCTGEQKRQVSCTPVGTCSTMNEPPKSQACQAPPCNEPTTECRDKTVFCDVPALGKYCDSNKFRSLCCESCTKVGNGSADSAAHMNRPTLHHHQTASGWLVSDWECSINESGQCTKRRTVKCGNNPTVELRRPALISHHQQSYPQPTQSHLSTTGQSRRKCQAGQKPAESETCASCD